MAGPMVGPLLERLGLERDHHLLGSRRRVPRPRAQPAAGGEPPVPDRPRAHRAGRPGDRLGRRRRSLLLHRRRGRRSWTATSSRRCWRATCSRSEPGATIVYDVRASRAVPDTVAEPRRHVARSTASATPSSSRPCASYDAAFGGEVSGHYYFRDFWCADSGTIPALLVLELLLGRRSARLAELVGAFRRALLHLRRDQLRGRRPGGEDARDRRALRRRRGSVGSTASRSTTPIGISTCARPTPSRCCGSTSSRSSRERTWSRSGTSVLELIRA